MKDLRDWYQYLEGISTGSAPAAAPSSTNHSHVAPRRLRPAAEARSSAVEAPSPAPLRSNRQGILRQHQDRLAMDFTFALPERRKPGRPALTESREEIVRRVLDPELTLHEASALLNVSKATVRRYTDQGKLPCMRTAGGQRRFRLSEILAFLEQRSPADVTS